MRLRGFAELVFADSARLALVRALERAHADCDQEHPEAWVVEDRRIGLSLDIEVDRGAFEAHRRLLDALVDDAAGGEASLDLGPPDDAGGERWARRASGSGAHPTAGRESGATVVAGHATGAHPTANANEDSERASAVPTIRTEAS